MLLSLKTKMRTFSKYILVLLLLLTCLICFKFTVLVLSTTPNIRVNIQSLKTQIYKMELQSNDSQCEVVHVGIVCIGYKFNPHLHTMLKSIFYFRSTPIHFHIFVDEASRKILQTLFATWSLPEVYANFYHVNNTNWTPFTNRLALLKLMFPDVITENVAKKIIIIDTDLIFDGDILQLWNLFRDFNDKQVIGLVEQQNHFSDKEESKKQTRSATEKGYNTGVILYHLEHLKSLRWNLLWTRTINKTMPNVELSKFTGEDVLNAVVNKNPNFLYVVPCQWNVQLLDNYTYNFDCFNNYKNKIIHWNASENLLMFKKRENNFEALFNVFLKYDGNLFKHQKFHCESATEMIVQKLSADECSTYRELQTHVWRTLLFIREFRYSPTLNDVTLVSQLSYNRLQMVELLSELWKGPVSFVIYLTDAELDQTINFIETSKVLQNRFNIAYHAVFKEGSYYPINKLRNIALQNVFTPYIFLTDIDFLPAPNIYNTIKKHISAIKEMSKKALIVPAFETHKTFPDNKSTLVKMLKQRDVIPFHYNRFKQGHYPTHFWKWRTATLPYKINWAPYFEPYVVVQRNVTEYDTRFFGFGWDKSSHIMELRVQGYEFIVLPDTFIVHKNHSPSFDLHVYKHSLRYKKCLKQRVLEFLETMKTKYGHPFQMFNIK